MTAYSKKLEFRMDHPAELPEKLRHYFTSYHFQEELQEDGSFVFYKKGSLFDGWKFNPLNWPSRVTVMLTQANTVSVHLSVPSHNVINSVVFTELYDGFLLNLKASLLQQKEGADSNAVQITRAKKNMGRYYGLMFLGVILAFFIGNFVQDASGVPLYGQITSIGLALVSVKLLNILLVNRVKKTGN